MDSTLFLKNVHVKNFRCLVDVGPSSLQQGLTLVAGQNDGGKSSWLTAISLLLENKDIDELDRANGIAEDEHVEVIGEFESRSSDGPQALTVRVRYEGRKPVKEVLKNLPKGMIAAPEDQVTDQLKQSIRMLRPEAPISGTKPVLFDRLQDILQELSAEEFEATWVPLDRETQQRLPRLQLFSSSTAADPEATVRAWTRGQVKTILEEERFSQLFSLVEQRVQSRVSPSFSRFSDYIQKHSDDLDGVDIKVEVDFQSVNPQSSIEFQRQGRTVDLSKSGEGRQRKTTLAIHEANLDILKQDIGEHSFILLYDEPDSHLDYPSQNRVARLLAEQSQIPNVQVIVATHSRNLIDGVPLESILVFRLDDELRTTGTALSSPLTDHDEELAYQSEIYMSLGLRNSVLLDDRVFLIVEGKTEYSAAPILYRAFQESTMAQAGIVTLDTDGSGASHEFALKLRSHWSKPVVLMLDSDYKDHQGKLQKLNDLGFIEGVDLFFVGVREFEDCFDNGHWVRMLNSHFPVNDGGPDWSADEIESCRGTEKFSVELQNRVNRRTRRSVAKPDLGRCLAILSQETGLVPNDIKKCLDGVRKLATDTVVPESGEIQGMRVERLVEA